MGGITANSTAAVLAGPIGDGGNGNGIIINAIGVLELSGTAPNTYTGTTTVWSSNATLKLNKTGATAIPGNLTITTGSVVLAQPNQIADSASLIVNGVLDLNGNSETVGSLLSGTGTITSGTARAATLTLGASANGNYSGIIQDGLGTVSIVKQGSGSLVLSTTNTFSGGVMLNSGTLGIFNGSALGTAPVSGTNLVFTGNSTLQFQGSTTANIAANRGFAINPGVSATIDTQAYTDVLDNSITGAGSLTKAGSGVLVLNGSNSYSGGTVLSSGTVNFSNLNALGSGTVTVSGNSTLLMGVTGTFGNNLAINPGATATLNPSTGNSTFSGTISGSGALARSGTYILTLSASNSYTGGTILTGAGNLDLGANGALGTGPLTLGDGADTGNVRLELLGYNQTITGLSIGAQSGHAVVIQNQGPVPSVLTIALASGTNSSTSNFYLRDSSGGTAGTLAVVKSGAGTLDFSNYAAMGYSGGLTVNGGVLAFSNGGALGSGSLTSGSGTLSVASGSSVAISNPTALTSASSGGIDTGGGTATFSGVISGTGALMKYGSGTLILSGTNTFSGDTIIHAGTLMLSSSQALAGSTFDTTSTGALSFGALTGATFGALKNSGNAVLSNTAGAAVTLSVGSNNQSSSYPGSLSGPGSLNKVGNATMTLTGSQAYTGPTAVSGGILQLGDGVTDASIASSSGIVDNASLVWNLVQNQSYAGALSGTGALTKNGGALTLTGSSAFAGAITIASGTLQIGDGAGGALSGGSINLNSGATLNINLPDGGAIGSSIYTYGNSVNLLCGGTNTINGNIYGYVTGVIRQSGTGTTILTGYNDFAGSMNIDAGTVQLNGAYSASRSTVNVDVTNGLAFGMNSPAVGALSGGANFVLLNGTNGVALNVGGNNANSTYTGSISGTSAASSLVKSGAGTFTLTGSNSYAGPTTISTGTLQLGDGTSGHDGSLSTSSIANSGVLVYDLSGSETVAYAITGTGGLIKTGAGGLTLANNMAFTGPIAVTSGTVTLTSGTAMTLNASAFTIASGARMVINNNNSNSVYAPSNSILTVQSGATLTQNAPTFLTGYLIAPTGAIINGMWATVTVQAADSDAQKTAVFGSISMGRILDGLAASGTQTLQFDGTGTGANIGTVSIRPAATGAYVHNMDIAHSPTAANGVDVTVPLLEVRPSAGSFAFNKLGAGVLQINGFIFNGSAPYTNNPVSCEVAAGKLILSGTGTNGSGVNFASVTVDSGATLQVGASGTVGAVYADILNDGAVDLKRSGAYTYSNAISGSGRVTLSGSGTITLSGNSSYSGGTSINSGTLQVGSANALGTGGVAVNGATLDLYGNSPAVGTLSGSTGAITNTVSGTATLITTVTGSSSYNGSILNGAGAVALVQNGPGTLTLSGSIRATAITASAGTVSLVRSGSIGAVGIGAAGKMELTANGVNSAKVIDASALSIDTGGTLDLWDNAMILRDQTGGINQGANLSMVQGLVNTAFDNGNWDKPGITSSTVIADLSAYSVLTVMVYDNTVLGVDSFEGINGLSTDNGGNQVMLKTTYLGDFDGNGIVNSADYGWLDFYYGYGLTVGDLNGDGQVNSADYNGIDYGYGYQAYGTLNGGGLPGRSGVGGGAAADVGMALAGSPEAVPEPGAWALVASGLGLLLGGRRRRG